MDVFISGIRVGVKFIVETIVVIFTTTFYWLEGIILACIPKYLRTKKNISGQVVVITGSAGGVGRLLSERFAQRNAQLALWDINEKENAVTRQHVEKFGVKVIDYEVNLLDKHQVFDAAKKVLADFGRIDILVNNAGIVTNKLFLDMDEESMMKVMTVNAMAHMWTINAFLPRMIQQKGGHIVSVASSAGLIGINYLTEYCSSKYAAVGLLDALSYELHDLGHDEIITTVICPYKIDTNMFPGISSKFYNMIPVLKAQEVADRIVEAVLLNERVVYIPRLLYTTLALKSILPVKCWWTLLTYLGMNRI